MKQLIRFSFVTILWMLFTLTGAIGQSFEPTILILSPGTTTADKSLKKEIADYDKLIKQGQKQAIRESKDALKEAEGLAENFKIMHQKSIEFSKGVNFYSSIPLLAEGYLQYRLFERFENLLIYATDEKSEGSLQSLSAIAARHKMQYVVNFPTVNLTLENGAKKTTIRVQLYDHDQGKLVLDKDFTGHDQNPGFEFACSEGSLSCTINNSLSQALSEIITIVASNNPSIIRERELAQERAELLFTKHYPKQPAKEIIDIIEKNDTSISTAGFYHGFMNEDGTKFIGFFALDSEASNFKELREKKDKNVQIISQDIYDLDNVPRIYASVAVGVYYDGAWYLKRDKVTYFDSDDFETGKKKFFNNLQKWNFFKENSSDFNPDFWETYFFAKVKDVAQEPDYEKYYESMYARQEKENVGYIGQYEIVAEKMREAAAERAGKFKELLGEQVLRPFLEQQKEKRPDEFADYSLMYEKFTLIFPKDRTVVLNPILIKNTKGQRQIKYLVVLPESNEIYEWTYLKPRVFESKSWHYGSEIVEQLSSITKWNFGFETLDDTSFWSNYVMKREKNEYVYLKKLN
jgi:hypothetical protein